MIDLLIWMAILAIVAIAAWFILNQVALPDPIRRIVVIVLVVVVAVIAIGVLLNLTGVGGIPMRLRGS